MDFQSIALPTELRYLLSKWTANLLAFLFLPNINLKLVISFYLSHMTEDHHISTVIGPLGVWRITATVEKIVKLSHVNGPLSPIENTNNPLNLEANSQLSAYFDGQLAKFDLPLDLDQGTPFMRAVWRAVAAIPYGETCSYKDIAIKLGDQNAVRAVGTANGKNPFPILVPCHRVIGENGSLTGYAFGVDVKKSLLVHELNFRQQPTTGMLF